jgi:sporulation protein YunB
MAQVKLDDIGIQGIDIPIGSFTGMPILMGRGPEIKIKLLPVASIQSHFLSEFESVGINQVKHRIYINVETTVNLVLPVANRKITTSSMVLVCESVIIGDVPAVYLNGGGINGLLNLVPDSYL